MAITYAQSPAIYAQPARRGPIARLLKQEHWLAVALLLPTVVLLGLFIAYPFVKGVIGAAGTKSGAV